jgi:hypothetical protein
MLEFPSTTLKGTWRLLVGEVSESNTDNEASRLERKCGTHRSDSPVWAFTIHHAKT